MQILNACSKGVIFICVKPSDAPSVFRIFQMNKLPLECLLISVCAGIQLRSLLDKTGYTNVARIMPNILCRVSESATCYTFSGEHKYEATLRTVLSHFGSVHRIEEHLFNAFTALSGSGERWKKAAFYMVTVPY